MTKTTLKTNYMKPTMPESLPIEGRRGMIASVATAGASAAQRSVAKQLGGGLCGWMGVRSYGFGQLAQLYYPDRDYNSALRLFHEELRVTRGLWKALTAEGYREKQKVLTRAQVKVIVRFLDPP